MQVRFCAWILLILLCQAGNLQAQGGRRGGGNGTILNIGPVLGFYNLNNKHAAGAARRPGFIAGIKREIRADRSYQTFVQFGAEYFVHGLRYSSYYFLPDSLQLYNKDFRYTYSLYVHEINVPLQLKILFNRGDNSLYSPYASASYQIRYLVQGILEIDEFGNRVRKDFPQMKFRNFLLGERMNAFVSLGLGWQRNKINDRGTAFFAELNFRYGFSDFYFEAPYAARSVFINGTHAAILLGLKF